MELKDVESFAILLCNEANDENSISNIVRKISLRKHIPFNRLTINGGKSYILYDVDKTYIFNMGTNKRLKFIYKNADEFYIIDFSNNIKGNIIQRTVDDVIRFIRYSDGVIGCFGIDVRGKGQGSKQSGTILVGRTRRQPRNGQRALVIL